MPSYSTYSSDDEDSSHGSYSWGKIPGWATAIILTASIFAVGGIFMAIVIYIGHRRKRREYKQMLESEPGLEWRVFMERWKERAAREAQLEEEEEDRRTAAEAEVRRARREERKNRKLQDKYRKKMAKGKGRSRGDEAMLLEERNPPPYSAAMDPESEVGMKPW